MLLKNPIIPGFHPDPSICSDDKGNFYLVNSSFESFPGVPIFKSTDLVNWEQIGHCLTRKSQLFLDKIPCSQGIWAPTIRFYKGVFYMTVTNKCDKGNMIVHTADPAGEWSEPVWVDQSGIDPSLYFEDDRAYFCTPYTLDGVRGIAMSEIDISTGKRLSDIKLIWTGSGGKCLEGPHVYKIGGYYYILAAEGGTEYGHMITVGRSKTLWGPYENCPHNPIMTHRNDHAARIQGVGHGDLIQDSSGNWFMVHLAFRMATRMVHHLGRETYLVPIKWENGWPVVDTPKHQVYEQMEVPTLNVVQKPFEDIIDDFDYDKFPFYWNWLRNPVEENYDLKTKKGTLRLKGTAVTLDEEDTPTFIGIRQMHFDTEFSAKQVFEPKTADDFAGITVLMTNKHHYDIGVTMLDGVKSVIVRRRIGDLWAVTASKPIADGAVELYIKSEDAAFHFGFKDSTMNAVEYIASGDSRYLSTEVAKTFTGVYLAMFVQSPSGLIAEYDKASYKYLADEAKVWNQIRSF